MAAPKRNILQFLLSYLFDSQVEHFSTKYNEVLDVKYYEGGYILDADTANFSFGALHRVFQLAFDQLKISERSIESALILGYGAGSVAQLLNERLNSPTIIGVEIDPKVIGIAQDYFGLDEEEHVHIEEMDAQNYIEASYDYFDLIVIDIFDNDKVPEKFFKKIFLTLVGKRLNPGGLLVFNAAIIGSGQNIEDVGKVFRRLFPDTNLLSLEANKVLVWENITRQ